MRHLTLVRQLHNGIGMKAPAYVIVIAILFLRFSFAYAETQQAGINARGIVESAEISGIAEDEISPEIRDAVRKLIGQPFNQQATDDLLTRIQTEKPEFTTTTRLLPSDQSDRVRVVFLLEKSNGDAVAEENVNSRYVVERVEIQGFDESRLSQSIRDELKMLLGEKLDPQRVDQIQRRIEFELRPKHQVKRRIGKGSNPQQLVVIYEINEVRWIPHVPVPSQRIVYHSKQNFSAAVNVPIPLGGGSRFNFGLVNDQDDLLERFAGFNLGFEMTKVATNHLGLALRYARYHERWQPSTVSAGATSVYRERNNFEPAITIAFDPRVRLTAGVSLSELEMQYPEIHRANSNAAMASLTVQTTWQKSPDEAHRLQGNYDLRAGNREMDSDFIYTRHLASAQYAYAKNRNRLVIGFLAGTIAGNAPLFERFSLGNTSTLRGWNKFDIAPLGGNRVVHATLQYGIASSWFGMRRDRNVTVDFDSGLHVFYDVGAVGDRGSPIQARHSAGFGIGTSDFSGFFLELGFPIRSTRVQPTFAMGFRF